MMPLHRVLVAVILAANALAFAGVDPPMRLLTAMVILVLAWDLRRLPAILPIHRKALLLLAGLVLLQLAPLPEFLRRWLQPGLGDLIHHGWAPLSVAPWATLQVASSWILLVVLALSAARMAATRSGLPTLLTFIAGTGVLIAILGLVSEAGTGSVLLFRADNSGGGPYGPFVNRNHFAVAVELTLPAAMVLLAAAARNLNRRGGARDRSIVLGAAALVGLSITLAALVRSTSRGGIIMLTMAVLLSIPWWQRYKAGRRWPWLLAIGLVLWGAGVLAWTRVPEAKERFLQMLAVEGVEGQNRSDYWAGTVGLWLRAPVIGSGLGSYRFAIGLDKPATAGSMLEQAHNDWLEGLSGGGVVGAAVALLFFAGGAVQLWPSRVRRLRYEFRYPLAGLVVATIAVSLHELIGFGLQTPLNRYLVACWLGLLWGVASSTGGRRSQSETAAKA